MYHQIIKSMCRARLVSAACLLGIASAFDGSHSKCSMGTQGKFCYQNPNQVVATATVADSDECCSRCEAERHCISFTFWGGSQCHLFSGVAGKTGGDCVSGVKPRMNFVFHFPDTLRAESFSSYGNPLPTTPNLDAFAKTGVRFEQAHVQHTQCSPSRATMLTGRYMHVLGHRTQTHLIQPLSSTTGARSRRVATTCSTTGRTTCSRPIP